ncbi:AEC family transporter [Alcaligenes sp. SDU_A2]|uniref:AEC family transporter n=1 Tax=Alcaligenes sp. SDU_A2 TaxID=3136634 RepID=UPI00311FEF58
MPAIFSLILPDFLLIALGALLLHRFHFSAEFFRGAEKLVYYVLFPALLFHSITRTPISLSEAWTLLLAAAALIAAGTLLAWLALPILKPDMRQHAAVTQCAFRFNTYLGMSLAGAAAGSDGVAVMALLVGFSVPMANMVAVSVLARGQQNSIWKEVLKNPLILATVLALAWNLLGLSLPAPIGVALNRLGACALGIGLLCVGATLSMQGARQAGPLIAWMASIKLLALPLVALLTGWLLQLSPIEHQMLLIFAALPTASSAHVLAARMGADSRLVALTMSIGTILAGFTIPFWLAVAG